MEQEVVPFSIPDITQQDREAVLEAINSRWLTGGPRVEEFERQFASYVGVKYAIAVNSCTAALHLAMLSLGIGEGDEVIVPALTFAATANAAIYCGAKPVFADVNDKTLNIDPIDIAKHINHRTRAIIVVHFAGQPCAMQEIVGLAQRHGLFVVEDCAHSLGAKYQGQQTGGIGDIGCFSFYPTKNITTLEGGMITTNNFKFAEKMYHLRNHCMTKDAHDRSKAKEWFYDIFDLGYNYRMNAVSAALGISQLSRVDTTNGKRVLLAKQYTQKLEGIPGLEVPFEDKDLNHVYHLYVIKIISDKYGVSRDTAYRELTKRGISISVHYTPLHHLSYYRKKLGSLPYKLPVSDKLAGELLSLPLFPSMTKHQLGYVVKQIKEIGDTKNKL